jgi:hypothetical protein
MSEINATRSLVKDTSKQDILNLPPMTDTSKLNTMKFMVRHVAQNQLISSLLDLSKTYCLCLLLVVEFIPLNRLFFNPNAYGPVLLSDDEIIT